MDMVIVNDEELFVLDDGTIEWQDKPFTGVAREYRADGSIVSETEYRNGVQEGIARYFHPSGKLYGEDHFARNSFHGPSREWNENGRLLRDALYEHAILVREKKWNENGTLIEDYELTEKDPMFNTLQDYRRRFGKLPVPSSQLNARP